MINLNNNNCVIFYKLNLTNRYQIEEFTLKRVGYIHVNLLSTIRATLRKNTRVILKNFKIYFELIKIKRKVITAI